VVRPSGNLTDSFGTRFRGHEEDWPEAFSRWIAEHTGQPPPRFEKVEPGDEQIFEDPEQRELDGVPSLLALRARRRMTPDS
jgi:hypothetical protein